MKKELNILIGANVPPDPNAGASGTVWQMAEALRRLGHRVDTFWAEDLGRRIKHGNMHYLFELPYTYRREVRRRAASKSFDIIELNQPHAYLAAQDHMRSRRHGVFINRSHGQEVRSEEALQPWRDRLNVKKKTGLSKWLSDRIRAGLDRHWERVTESSDGFIVSCTEDRDFIHDRYRFPLERIGLITQAVPDNYLSHEPVPMSPERAIKFIYVGQLAFFKAPHMLAAAVNRILATLPQATFTWVCGNQHHAEAMGLFDEGIRSRVVCKGWMPQDELISVLDQHGIFLFPSYFEGFGKAPLEAMARGLCVIASQCGGMRDYIRNGTNGLLVPVGKPEVMAEGAVRLAGDVRKCQEISRAARETALEHNWDRCARDAEAFYRQMIQFKYPQEVTVQ